MERLEERISRALKQVDNDRYVLAIAVGQRADELSKGAKPLLSQNTQKMIYDTNQINVALNMSLPEDELVEYIKYIKKTLSDEKSKKLKSPNKLLGKEVKDAEKTANYPKKPTVKKLADMFFVYDYITAKLEELKSDSQLMTEEYNENKENIKNDKSCTTKEKEIQLEELLKEYEENKTSIKVENIFKDFDKPIKGIDLKR